MPIHFIDPATGNDANNGLGWATPWKTTNPLTALYPGSAVSDLELRFAKTPKLYDSSFFLQSLAATNYFGGYGAGLNPTAVNHLSGNTILDNNTAITTALNFVMVAPFTSTNGSGSGSYMKQFTVPIGATGRAAYFTTGTTRNLATLGLEAIEMWCSLATSGNTDTTNLTAALHLCSDTVGVTTIVSYPLTIGVSQFRNVLNVLGTGALPDGVNSVALYVTNNTGVAHTLYISQIMAVPPVASATYTGFRAFAIPNHTPGQCLQISSISGASVFCAGIETGNWRFILGAANATWAVYAATPVTPTGIKFPNAQFVGTEASPIIIRGGFNKTTGEVDGLTAIDADQIKLFGPSVLRVAVVIQDIAVAFARDDKINTGNRSCIMGGGFNNLLPLYYNVSGSSIARCYSSPNGPPSLGAGGFNGAYNRHAGFLEVRQSTFSNEYIRNVSVIGGNYWGPPIRGGGFVNGPTPAETPITPIFANATFCSGFDFSAVTDAQNLVIYEGKTGPNVVGLEFKNCGFYASGTTTTGVALTSPTFTDCSFHGAYTVPSNGLFVRPRFEPYLYLQGIMIQGTSSTALLELVDIQTPISTYNSPQNFIEGGFYRITIRDTVCSLRYPRLINIQPLYTSNIDCAVNLKNTTITTLHNAPAAFASFAGSFQDTRYRLVLDNVVVGGPWTTLVSGNLPTILTNNVVLDNPVTKVADAFQFKGQIFGSGEVSAYFGGVTTGNLTPLGTPVTGAIRSSAGTFKRSNGNLVMFTTAYQVEKDFGLKIDGQFSWRMTLSQNVGSGIIGSMRVGMLTLRAGAQVMIRAKIQRASAGAQGQLRLRPLGTKDYPTSGLQTLDHDVVTPLLTLLNTWETRESLYTPARTAVVEVFMCVFGISGTQVWFDQVEVLQ